MLIFFFCVSDSHFGILYPYLIRVHVNFNTHQRGRGSRVDVRIPPHRPVDVNVLHEECHQQVEEEQELEEQAAVQRKLRDAAVAYWFGRNQGGERGSRETWWVTAPGPRKTRVTHNTGAVHQLAYKRKLKKRTALRRNASHYFCSSTFWIWGTKPNSGCGRYNKGVFECELQDRFFFAIYLSI